MSAWHFWNRQTGEIADYKFDGSEKLARLNAPADCIPIEGRFDRLSQRVDVETGLVVDDPELAETSRRFAEQARKESSAQAAIVDLELRQMRSVRELLIDSTNVDARAKLEEIETQINEHRKDLSVVVAEQAVRDLVPEGGGAIVVDPLGLLNEE